MDTMNTQTMAILAIVVLLVVAIAAWLWNQRVLSRRRLKERFGPEYARTVEELGSRPKAEAELRDREQRVRKLDIVPLVPADAARFTRDWKALQLRFVDNPRGVLTDADRLVRELMASRGYPMGDFERRAADVSVDHPAVVDHYRAAQAIALRDRRGEADTEELRKAVVHYRTLFDDLLQVGERDSQRDSQPMEIQR